MSGDVLILGAGRSGSAVAEYCAKRPERFGSVTLADSGDSADLRAERDRLVSLGVDVLLGVESVPGQYELCVASPGIKPTAPLMCSAAQVSAEVVSELEFAYRESDSRWVAVTGTNGKTTTTALVTHLLCSAGIPAVSVGNIGAAATAAVDAGSSDTVLVAEVSSFQLAFTSQFHPRVAVLLNITPDHIDWHGSLDEYARDKGKVFANMTEADVAVIDVDDRGSATFVEPVSAGGTRVIPVCGDCDDSGAATVCDGVLTLDVDGLRTEVLGVDAMQIKGPHNVSNALAAAAAAHACGASIDAIARGLATFAPIEHRLEPVATVAGVEWFNDSKATNPDAVSKALASFGDRPLVLLLGGRNKGNDFRPLATEAARRARVVIAFGEARVEIAPAFEGTGAEPVIAKTLEEAVHAAARVSVPGDAVLLSPACASFDEFNNYEERGRVFKRLVHELVEQAS